MPSVRVICVGNTLRGDDGAAHRVAALLLERGTPASVTTAPQLDITMADDVAACDLLFIVDAERRDLPPFRIDEVFPGAGANRGHAVDAQGLLGLSETLFGSAPRCLLVTLAGPHMEHGEMLSKTAVAACEQAATEIDLLVKALS